MNQSKVLYEWEDVHATRRYRTGVSLHGHTFHSRESLSFISRVTKNVPYLSPAIRRQEAKYRAAKGRDLDLTRAWWTPPLSPSQAVKLEADQIEERGLNALVSLSDHDNIDAGNSVEWTVPFRQTFFHIGIHNVPPERRTEWMDSMLAFTANPVESLLLELLTWFGEYPETLVILNHPMWDEKGIGAGRHWSLLREFLRLFGGQLHALELNGLRPWKENKNVITVAAVAKLPVISGGDRHAREPNACINLTNAATFAEFADEVRTDGWSDVLFLPQYQEKFRIRIIKSLCEVIREDTEHELGWTKWSDRCFYLCDDGVAKSLSDLWATKIPAVVNQFVALMGLVRLGLRSSRTASMR